MSQANDFNVLYVDMDGVLSDWAGGFLNFVNKRLGTSFKHADITEYDMPKALGLDTNLIIEYGNHPKSFSVEWVPILPGALEGFRYLMSLAERGDFELNIVTSPFYTSRTCEAQKRNWVEHYFPDFNQKFIWFGCNKHRLVGSAIIDDKPSTIEKIRDTKGGMRPLLFDQPWNQGVRGVERVDWDFIMSFI